jgi:hypothetical protein
MAYATRGTRNVGLVGQAGAGKTLLLESLLLQANVCRSTCPQTRVAPWPIVFSRPGAPEGREVSAAHTRHRHRARAPRRRAEACGCSPQAPCRGSVCPDRASCGRQRDSPRCVAGPVSERFSPPRERRQNLYVAPTVKNVPIAPCKCSDGFQGTSPSAPPYVAQSSGALALNRLVTDPCRLRCWVKSQLP